MNATGVSKLLGPTNEVETTHGLFTKYFTEKTTVRLCCHGTIPVFGIVQPHIRHPMSDKDI